jgi:hypothetical protein
LQALPLPEEEESATAYTENAIVHQGVLDQGVALLQKPFGPGALAHKLREGPDPTNMLPL